MPIIHQTPIAMTALNSNIDSDLVFSGSYTNIKRNANTGSIRLLGGSDLSHGGSLRVISSAGNSGFYVSVPDSSYSAIVIDVLSVAGHTDTPYLDLLNHRIAQVLNPTDAQDAATKHYTDDADALKLNAAYPTVTAPPIKRDVDNDFMAIYGGSGWPESALYLYGHDHATMPGQVTFYMLNAAKTSWGAGFTITGNTDQPRLAGSAFNWVTWSPTLSWTGTPPASMTNVFKYVQIGSVVFFNATIYSDDGNGATNLTITLPVQSVNAVGFYGWQRVDSTYTPSILYCNASSSTLGFLNFQPATDGKILAIRIAGFYEVVI